MGISADVPVIDPLWTRLKPFPQTLLKNLGGNVQQRMLTRSVLNFIIHSQSQVTNLDN